MPTTGRATARRPPKTAGSACSPGSRKTASRNFLIRVHPGLLDERAPFVDLGLEVLAQRLGRGLAHRHGLGAEIGEALLHRVVLDGLLERGDELVNHRLRRDRKSTRLNSSHGYISYAVFCLKKKKKNKQETYI